MTIGRGLGEPDGRKPCIFVPVLRQTSRHGLVRKIRGERRRNAIGSPLGFIVESIERVTRIGTGVYAKGGAHCSPVQKRTATAAASFTVRTPAASDPMLYEPILSMQGRVTQTGALYKAPSNSIFG